MCGALTWLRSEEFGALSIFIVDGASPLSLPSALCLVPLTASKAAVSDKSESHLSRTEAD